MKIRILQGFFDGESQASLDSGAEPIDVRFNLGNPLYEYALFTELLDRKIMEPDKGPVGLLSWKFNAKTQRSVNEFSAFCEKAFAEGADVAFINPMLDAEALYANVWEQGEYVGHRGLLYLYETLFPGLQDRLEVMPSSVFAFCNYFVGNARFWERYRAFCDDFLERVSLLQYTHPDAHSLLHSTAHYVLKPEADFRPFLIERLFSTFLLLNPEIKGAAYPHGLQAYVHRFGSRMGDYLHTLSRLKERASTYKRRSQSPWEQMRRPLLEASLRTEVRRRHAGPPPSHLQGAESSLPGPLRCIFTIHQDSPDFSHQLEQLKVAIWTLQRHTRLQPVLVYGGESNSTTNWLQAQGVEIIPPKSLSYAALQRLAQECGPGTLDAGLKTLAWLDFPEICAGRGWGEERVLVCDCSVVFQGDPDEPWPSLNQGSVLGAVPGKDPRKPEEFTTAVALVDVAVMLRWVQPLRALWERQLSISEAVNFRDFIYRLFFFRQEWTVWPPEMSWKPSWGINPRARIIHFPESGMPLPRRKALAHRAYGELFKELHAQVGEAIASWQEAPSRAHRNLHDVDSR